MYHTAHTSFEAYQNAIRNVAGHVFTLSHSSATRPFEKSRNDCKFCVVLLVVVEIVMVGRLLVDGSYHIIVRRESITWRLF